MGQKIHLEIEMLVSKPSLFFRTSDVGEWCWAMSYSPTEEEAIGFHELLDDPKINPSFSATTKSKIDSWKHNHVIWWSYVDDFLELLNDLPFSVRSWFLSWGSEHLGLLGQPSSLRIIILVSEGDYD